MARSLMGCCIVHKDGSRSELDHDKTTTPGTAFYYCSVHRVYHCVEPQAHRHQLQPPCGECAWLFFQFPKEAAKYPGYDVVPISFATGLGENVDADVAATGLCFSYYGWGGGKGYGDGGVPSSDCPADPSKGVGGYGGKPEACEDLLSVFATIIDGLDNQVRTWKQGRRAAAEDASHLDGSGGQ
ncbi:hypothetical protein GGR52DRAFT_572357 [Hypoxylon sp. FL1284]|nr:hypothetical protein GGR52DRAFT_572357 [Hypoxylon sp. FL1284]